MSTLTLYIGNDNVITLSGLKDAIADSFVNDATVDVTLQDSDGNNISGETWPLSLSYVAASNGNYRATLADTLTLTQGDITAIVNADAGPGLKGNWRLPVSVEYRTQ